MGGEVADQVRPTELALPRIKAAVGPPAIGADNALEFFAQQPGRLALVAALSDPEDGSVAGAHPAALRATGLATATSSHVGHPDLTQNIGQTLAIHQQHSRMLQGFCAVTEGLARTLEHIHRESGPPKVGKHPRRDRVAGPEEIGRSGALRAAHARLEQAAPHPGVEGAVLNPHNPSQLG